MPAVRGAGGSTYTMFLNRTLGAVGQDGHEVFTSTGTIWEIAAQTDRDYGPPISGYVGWYIADSWDGGTSWLDLSGNNNHATVTNPNELEVTRRTSTPGQENTSIYFRCLRGSITATVLWPAAILPATYTLFHVARYSGGNESRIFQSATGNWLSGFWGGLAGQAFHNGWLTNSTTDYFGRNWVISTDQNSLYRGFSGGTTVEGTGGGGTSARLAINTGSYPNERSDWEIAEIIVYPRTLSVAEYTTVENWLKAKYGMI